MPAKNHRWASPIPRDLRDRRRRVALLAALQFPIFNPIEQFFAKLKALLRNAAARTVEALIAAIAEVLTEVRPQECANYLANQGYRHEL